MKLSKRGFTLIELLAVIVVLAIIALIATPTILGVIEKAKKGAAESSALSWVNAVENQIAINLVDTDNNNNIVDGTYTVSDLLSTYGVSVKGKIPAGTGTTTIANGKVSALNVDIDGYSITYDPATGKATSGASSPSTPPSTPTPDPTPVVIPTIDTCPGCVYAYTTDLWYYSGETQTTLTSSQYEEDYREVVNATGRNYFLGMKVNEATGVIEKAYACGIKDGETFCLEGSTDGSTYAANASLLQSERLYNGECDQYATDVDCYGSVNANVENTGYANVRDLTHGCYAFDNGSLKCN